MTENQLQDIIKRAVQGRRGIEDEGGGPSGDAWATCAEDVPALVAEIERLRQDNRDLRQLLIEDHQECGVEPYEFYPRKQCLYCSGDAEGHTDDCDLANLVGAPPSPPGSYFRRVLK